MRPRNFPILKITDAVVFGLKKKIKKMKIAQKFRNICKRVKLVKNWPFFMWPLCRVGRWPRTAKLRSGAKIILKGYHSSEMAIFNEIIIDDAYEISSFGNPKRIIDIGANIGIFAVTVAKKYPKATIIAIEPEKNNFAALTRNIQISDAKNIIAVKKAVSSKAGKSALRVSPDNKGAHSLLSSSAAEETQEVEITTLDEFLPADIIKLDAEGAEYEIFEKSIPDCHKIVMETHEGDNEKLIDKLASKYKIFSKGKVYILEHK